MKNFIFDNKTTIIFGKNTEQEVGKEVKKYGNKVLLHYGGGSIKQYGLHKRVIASLEASGIEYFELGGVKPNPRVSLVREGIKLCKAHQIDFILAVGGGSVIDSAKAIGFGAKYDGDVWDFFTYKVPVTETIPLGVILTIPAAGSESSSGTVITNEEGWFKKGAGGLVARPKFAVMNPELTFTLPSYQTACGAADMMAHVFERYFTNEPNVEFTDELCEATLRTIIKHTKIAIQDPTDYAARAELMWAGTIAHNGLLGTGRIEDWSSHLIEHELSALYDIAHGAGLAIIFPHWMLFTYKQDIPRFARFANKVFGVELDFHNLEKTAIEGIERLKQFFKEIGLPTSFKEANLPTDRIDEMAEKIASNRTIGSFVTLTKDDIIQIYQLAID